MQPAAGLGKAAEEPSEQRARSINAVRLKLLGRQQGEAAPPGVPIGERALRTASFSGARGAASHSGSVSSALSFEGKPSSPRAVLPSAGSSGVASDSEEMVGAAGCRAVGRD